jgi:hypothetical protein
MTSQIWHKTRQQTMKIGCLANNFEHFLNLCIAKYKSVQLNYQLVLTKKAFFTAISTVKVSILYPP